jgi:hypothetical protein
MAAAGCGCFLCLQRFSASVSVCNMGFSAHKQHGSMLESAWCACGGMLSLFFSAQESLKSNEKQRLANANGD